MKQPPKSLWVPCAKIGRRVTRAVLTRMPRPDEMAHHSQSYTYIPECTRILRSEVLRCIEVSRIIAYMVPNDRQELARAASHLLNSAFARSDTDLVRHVLSRSHKRIICIANFVIQLPVTPSGRLSQSADAACCLKRTAFTRAMLQSEVGRCAVYGALRDITYKQSGVATGAFGQRGV